MSHPQLHPLQFNVATGEPFLRLPSPLENITITPPRLSDTPYVVRHMNDPNIVKWFQHPPYPYLVSHADAWLPGTKASTDAVIQELEKASQDNPSGLLRVVGECPVRTLREIQEDGTDIFIGDIGIHRCAFDEEKNPEVQRQLSEENARREVGDPEIVWCVGCKEVSHAHEFPEPDSLNADYLVASHHGRGIMSVALRTLLTSWAIPRMAAVRFRVEVDKDNGASVRVFEKFGFEVRETVDKVSTNSFGRTKDGAHILWWEQR